MIVIEKLWHAVSDRLIIFDLSEQFFRQTMSQRQRDIVYGYLRSNYNQESMIDDIIKIIYNYFFIKIATKILNENEQCSLINLLFNKLKWQKENENIKSINIKLLFRLSENGNSCNKFHDYCDNKGATITIIDNDKNHVFGGYTSQSWMPPTTIYPTPIKDPNAFIFTIRPTSKCIDIKQAPYVDAVVTVVIKGNYGPIFGAGKVLSTRDAAYFESDKGVICNSSVNSDFDEMPGINSWEPSFVNDMEIFQVSIAWIEKCQNLIQFTTVSDD